MSRTWSRLVGVGLALIILNCQSNPLPTLTGYWGGFNERHDYYYEMAIVEGSADGPFSGTGLWYGPDTTGPVEITGIVAGGMVEMTMEYDSGSAAQYAKYTAALSRDDSMAGLEAYAADSAPDSLSLARNSGFFLVGPSLTLGP